MTQAVMIFFNQETLSDEVQSIVNQTLRGLFQQWKAEINSLNDKVQGKGTAEEEHQLVDGSVNTFTGLMTRETMRVFTLSQVLHDRDSSV